MTTTLHALHRPPPKYKVYEKVGTLRISVQEMKKLGSRPGQAVQAEKVALESVAVVKEVV